jgi:hypothetical protein
MSNKKENPFQAPFKYDSYGCIIWDANGMWCLDIRGTGHLTGTCSMNLPPEEAEKLQDTFGELVVKLLNEDYEKNK